MIDISIIIPVHNNKEMLIRCLDSVLKSGIKNVEIIVVDDASTTNIKDSLDNGIGYYRLDTQSGPAAARNLGASKASGEILMFLDSDIVIEPDTISKFKSTFDQNPDISAIFGSYDSEPECKDFLSQYKNLVHHIVHQNSNTDAKTFWAGCGAVRKSAFEDAGGFNEIKYQKPSIEDIELGYRLKYKGYNILLDKDIQVKHLKSWRFSNWLKVEIFNRAIPWSELILETGDFHSDLNLKITDRISAILVWLMLILFVGLLIDCIQKDIDYVIREIIGLLLVVFCLIILNFNFYRFLFYHRGFKFLIKSIPVHILYYIYSSLAFGYIWIKTKLR